MSISPYFFDVLPLHPSPETFESLTSYLMRLAEKNGWRRFSSLQQLIATNAHNDSQLSDYSCSFLDVLADRADCSKSQLLLSTMYHLVKKLIRGEPHALPSFFKGSLGEYLRYCPLCISEKPYYRLSWRFLSLKGCSVHGCRFLDACGLCGKSIPLFVLPAKVGTCPRCFGSLDCSTTSLLSEAEMEETRGRTRDLKYLLSPQPCEQKRNAHRAMRLQLKAIREDKRISIEQAAKDLALPSSSFKFLEWGHNQKSGWRLEWNQIQLQAYFTYTDYLDTSLKSLFTYIDSLTPNEHESEIAGKQVPVDCLPLIKFQLREKELYQQVKHAIQSLNACQVEVTLSSISNYLHISLPTLSHYPAVMTLVREITNHSKPRKKKAD